MVNRRSPSMIDQFERASDDLDRLIRDARLIPGRHHAARYHDIEERAVAIADAIRAAARGPQRAAAPPLAVETRGRRTGAWF